MASGRIKGITVVIGGDTTGLDKALQNVDRSLSSTQKALKDVNRLLKLDPKNTELLAQKQRLLKEAIEDTEKRLDSLKQADKQAKKQLDSGDLGQDKYDALQREIIETEKKLESLKTEFKTMDVTSSGFADSLGNVGNKAKAAGDAIQPLSTAAAGLLAAMAATVPATEELRTDLSRLENNAKNAGVAVDVVNDAFDKFVVISDEVDSSVEATSNLLQAGFTESNLEKAVKGLSAAYLAFPDTLKIESLADSLQETLATGNAVGQYAELLERLGVDLETFEAGLAGISDEADRQNYALQILEEQGLYELYDSYMKNNEALMQSKEATQEFQEALAGVAEVLTPIITRITEMATAVINWFTQLDPAIQNTILAILALVAALGPMLSLFGTIAISLSVLGTGFLSVAGIVAAVVAAVVAALLLLAANFEQVKARIQMYIDNVKQFMENLGQKTEEVFQWMVTAISTAIANIVNFIVDFVRVVGEWFEKMKNTIKEKVESAKENAVTAFENLVNGIKEKVSGITDIVTEGFQGAIDFITSLPEKAIAWGRDFIDGLKQGIMDRVNGIVNAVKGIADQIASYLHFSRPDKGPLHYYEEWMPDMMEGLAKGITNNIPLIQKAVNDVSEVMSSGVRSSSEFDYARMDGIIQGAVRGNKPVVVIDSKSFKRGLADLGVQFG